MKMKSLLLQNSHLINITNIYIYHQFVPYHIIVPSTESNNSTSKICHHEMSLMTQMITSHHNVLSS